MSLIKQLFPSRLKFTPASQEVNWTRIETLVHGPGASEVGKRGMNSAVYACLMAIATAYPEPPLTVRRKLPDGNTEAIPDHPLQQLLSMPTPNGELSIEELLFWTAWAKNLDGNAYWLKMRSGNPINGNVVQLWPVSPSLIEPVTEGEDWISYYKYRIAPNQTVGIPVQNIVHFRLGLDDQDMRKGLSPLKALLRHISTDEEADKFTETLLRNYAVPGLVVVPAQGTILSEEDANRITAKMRQKFGGENRGNIAVMSKESTISAFGFSPKDLEITSSHRLPEERISAVMGVPALVAGLGAGLDRATYANAAEMREMFTEMKLIPTWRADAGKINTALLVDFDSNPDVFVEFDISNVRALQEDEDKKYNRLKAATGKAWLTVNEARADTGYDPVDGGDELSAPQPEQLRPPQDSQAPDENTPQEEDEEAKELRTWRVWAIRRIERKQPLDGFKCDHVGPFEADRIAGMLKDCTTAEDVKAVFRTHSSADPFALLAAELKRANDFLEAVDEPTAGAR